jgi:hypothetical protein
MSEAKKTAVKNPWIEKAKTQAKRLAREEATLRLLQLIHTKSPVRPGKLRRQAEVAERQARLAGQRALKRKAPERKKTWDTPIKSPAHVVSAAAWKVGDKIQFPRSGTAYQKQLAGNMVRISPVKPYKTRAEQKRWNKERRRMREEDARMAAQNEEALYGTYQDAPAQW